MITVGYAPLIGGVLDISQARKDLPQHLDGLIWKPLHSLEEVQSIEPSSSVVVLPPMDEGSINELSSPFWALVKTLMARLPKEMDTISTGDRRKAVAEILWVLGELEECRPPYLIPEYAARYDYLRSAHWESHPVCVVSDPKVSVKLGQECPSGVYLDNRIDQLRSSTEGQ